MQRILIDENLSPLLVSDAQQKGFLCSHVNHLGKAGKKDWELKRTILEGDWTFVTNNSIDFRGPADKPGSSGEYADVRLHAGLVCVDAPFGLNLDLQRAARDGDCTPQPGCTGSQFKSGADAYFEFENQLELGRWRFSAHMCAYPRQPSLAPDFAGSTRRPAAAWPTVRPR